MGLKVLNIIECAYRATIEEQDDTIVWVTTAMKGAGADVDVVLTGNAVNYGVRGQNASGLAFGGIAQGHPPDLAADVARLLEKGAAVYIVEEDLAERGLERTDLIEGLRPVARTGLPALIDEYSQVWHW